MDRKREDGEWRRMLDPEVYAVCRAGGTEPPFTGRWLEHHDVGVYSCACCGAGLFSSSAKFDSGSGWPSFQSALPDAVTTHTDLSHGMLRTEVRCAACEAHLGHVFPDGPPPTGARFCINSVCLDFAPEESGGQGPDAQGPDES